MFIEKNPIDTHLAKALRLSRLSFGISQYRLGEMLGVTFQQIQKYETASNKIPASRLYEICQLLKKPISGFFKNMDIDKDFYNFKFISEGRIITKDNERNKEIINLVRSFNAIEDKEVRLGVIGLVKNISKSQSSKN